jgi:hypothetical protein
MTHRFTSFSAQMAMKIIIQIDALTSAAANSANHFSEDFSDARLARSDRRERPRVNDDGISTPRHNAPATFFVVRLGQRGL